MAHDRLRRPAVFHKVCAHELALRKQQARLAAAAGIWIVRWACCFRCVATIPASRSTRSSARDAVFGRAL